MSRLRVLLCTYGSRGDVEPFVALARGLLAEGHDVLLATSERFRGFVEGHRVPFFAMSDASLALIETPDGQAMLEGGAGWWRRIVAGIRLSRRSGPINETLMRQTWEAAQTFEPTAIVFHAKLFAAGHVAEKLGIPAYLGALQPMYAATDAFPAMGFPALGLPGYNRADLCPRAPLDRTVPPSHQPVPARGAEPSAGARRRRRTVPAGRGDHRDPARL